MISSEFYKSLDRPIMGMQLFNHVPDIVYFVKDDKGRYINVNTTLVKRLSLSGKEDIIGKRVDELYPGPMGEGYIQQDRSILKTGIGITGRLELHLYPNGKQGWCLTYKEPIIAKDGRVLGLVGISKDIHAPTEKKESLAPVQEVLDYVRRNVDQPLRLPDLAEMVDLSVYQLDQRIRGLYNISAGQLITQTRIEKACNLLKSSREAIANIALDCGYSDQSAFTRQFKQTTGSTPKDFRNASKS